MIKSIWCLCILTVLSLSGCILDPKKLKDTDRDGIADKIDCAPENNTQWRLNPYQSIDSDLDGKFTQSTGELCIGNDLPTNYMLSKISTYQSDCDDTNSQIWSLKTYNSIDNDLDEKFILESGLVCSGNNLPPGYQLSLVDESQVDCNDSDHDSWKLMTTYHDSDRDGYGIGDKVEVCVGNTTPSEVAFVYGDCDDENPQAWNLTPYLAQDTDLDGAFVPAVGDVCAGARLPPAFLASLPNEPADCDDSNAKIWLSVIAYQDADNDNFGTGEPASYCIGEALPKNLSANATDCDDDNSDLFSLINYQASDIDLDSFQIISSGTECTNGALSSIYQINFDHSKSPDCNDNNTQVWQTVELYKDNDGDSIGAGEKTEHCIGSNNPELWVEETGDCADSNNQIWRNRYVYADTDKDSYGDINNWELACIGELPATGQVFDTSDCDDTNETIWRLDQAYFDIDGDGIGAGAKTGHCTNENPAENTSYLNYDCDDNDVNVFRNIVIYPDTDSDGIGAGKGSITCMGSSYLEGNVSIFGYDPEPDNSAMSNFALSPAILAIP